MLTLACSTAAQDSAATGETVGQSSTVSATATATDTSPGGDTDAQATTSGGTTTADSGTTEALTGGPSGSTTETSPGTGTDPGTTGLGTTTGFETTTTGDTETTTEGTGTTGSPLEDACEVDADCKLSTDCCTCYGLPVDEDEVEICDERCLQSKCDEIGIDQAVCRFGQCTTEKLDCSSPVACDALPPECPEGTLPGVGDSCWTGGCVPAAACDKVPECALCPESTMCVEYQAQLTSRTCEPIPAGCEGEPNCECASEACFEPFGLCLEGAVPTDLMCSCPTC